jgi:hypothetical protein
MLFSPLDQREGRRLRHHGAGRRPRRPRDRVTAAVTAASALTLPMGLSCATVMAITGLLTGLLLG